MSLSFQMHRHIVVKCVVKNHSHAVKPSNKFSLKNIRGILLSNMNSYASISSGSQSTKHTSSLAMSSWKNGATDHVRSASEAITQQAAAGMNLERPTAQDKAKQRPAENTKAAGAKQKVISQDHTQGREAHVGETEAMQFTEQSRMQTRRRRS